MDTETENTLSSTRVSESSKSDSARYEALIRIFPVIGQHDSIAELASALATQMSQLINFDFIGISRYDEAASSLEWHVSARGASTESGTIVAPAEEAITACVYRNQQPVVIPVLDYETRFRSAIPRIVQDGIQSICAVPLSCAHHRVGCLFMGSVIPNVYTVKDVRFLSLIATQVAGIVENNLAYRQIAEFKDKLEQQNLCLEDEIREEHGFDDVVGRSSALRSVLRQVETVAPTDSTVLICGETGTGKEIIARAIHERSPRQKNAFVKLNCAAIPTGLLESELFGHEKGAFTGAIAPRLGRFELANHGTMFLDEIGEIPLQLQPKLLRVLQEREFERLGNNRTLRTDTRLVAATNCDLEALVEEQRFRSDLLYRVNVFPIRLPPLRERTEDIPLLVRYFVQQFARRMNKQIETVASKTMSMLCKYHWPGNVRELQNVVERAVIMSNASELRVPVSDLTNRLPPPQTLEQVERTHILATLEQTGWVISGPTGAAARLAINRSTLHFRMKKLGIDRPRR